jgi:hypothetical protein
MEGLIVKNQLETARKEAAKFEGLHRYFTGWAEENKEHSFGIADLGGRDYEPGRCQIQSNSTFSQQ